MWRVARRLDSPCCAGLRRQLAARAAARPAAPSPRNRVALGRLHAPARALSAVAPRARVDGRKSAAPRLPAAAAAFAVALAGTVGASAWTTRAQADGEAVPQTESAVLELVKQRAALISATLPNVAEDLRRHCSDLSGFTLRPVDIPLATAIDHTLLKPQATGTDIQKLCEEAAKHKFGAVCVNGSNVPRAVAHLRSLGAQQVKVAAVVGFPLGASSPEVKFVEAFQAIQEGATELDMVINIGRLKEGDYAYVLRDLDSVIGEAQRTQVPVKVILETGALSPSEIVDGCLLSVAAGATFVKTSTGFGPGGATVETVRLMKMAVGNAAQVKASGGVRSLAEAKAMLAVGASRIGTSSGVSIVAGEGAGAKGSY